MGVKIQISLYISPSSGLFFISPDEDLLFEVETSRVNFLVSFNSDDQRNTDVATTADQHRKDVRKMMSHTWRRVSAGNIIL